MKKGLIIFIVTILSLILMTMLVFIYTFTGIDRESRRGLEENNQAVDLNGMDEPITITYMGDGLTAGVLSDGTLDEQDGYRGVIHRELSERNLFEIEYNFAVDSYTIEDLILQVESNTMLSDVSDQSQNNSKQNLNAYSQGISIRQALKNSDVLIITAGLSNVLTMYDDIDNNIRELMDTVYYIRDLKVKLFKEIHMINPDIKIYDVGMYIVDSNASNNAMRKRYPLLTYIESKILIDDEKSSIYPVIVRDNFQSNLTSYLDNPDSFYPNRIGYNVMGGEILKKISQTN